MIQIVMKPTPGEGVVNRETLYTALFNGGDIGLRVRGLRASHAEAKMMVVFREQLKDKIVDYDLERYLEGKENEKSEEPAPEEGAAHGERVLPAPGVRSPVRDRRLRGREGVR